MVTATRETVTTVREVPTEAGSLIFVTSINGEELPEALAAFRTHYAWYRLSDQPWPRVGGLNEAFQLFGESITGWAPAILVKGYNTRYGYGDD